MKNHTKQHLAVLVPLFLAAMVLMAATEYAPQPTAPAPILNSQFSIFNSQFQTDTPSRLERLALAFARVESHDNPNAANTAEDAVGWLQIRPIVIAEANRISGVDMFWPEDRETKSGSFIIFAKIMETKNPELDIRKACRIWNPRGGEKYYREVKEAFDNIK